VTLKQVNVENVSPTLGNDQLHAGIIAGIIGLALVAIYMLALYRLLGLVVIAGILLSGMALYSLIAWILPDVLGITIVLSLAGVTGIIVSVGITVDSYIVYFERMKDELRAGATVRSCVDRSFTRAFRTIVAADLVSLIGALVLYVLAIGSVRGFALFLMISTILDLFVAYFFMHPLVSIMARRSSLVSMPGVGIAAGLDAPAGVTT
jgi:preprotein translocase subunit SecD